MRTADAFSAQTPKAQFEPQSSTAITWSCHTGMCGFQPSLDRITQIHNNIYTYLAAFCKLWSRTIKVGDPLVAGTLMGPLVSEVQNPKTPNSAPHNSFGEALSETLSSLFIGNWQGQKQKVLGMIKQERLIWLLWRLSLWKGICNVSCWMQGSDLQQAEADGAKNHALPLQLSTELQQGQYAVVEAVYMGVHIDMDVLDRLWSEKWKVLQGSIQKNKKTGLRSLAELSQVTKKRIKKGIVKE